MISLGESIRDFLLNDNLENIQLQVGSFKY